MATHHSASEIKHDGALNGAEGKIRASHLLVKHRDSRRPSSWREVGDDGPYQGGLSAK